VSMPRRREPSAWLAVASPLKVSPEMRPPPPPPKASSVSTPAHCCGRAAGGGGRGDRAAGGGGRGGRAGGGGRGGRAGAAGHAGARSVSVCGDRLDPVWSGSQRFGGGGEIPCIEGMEREF
jgi:hypothetical protein